VGMRIFYDYNAKAPRLVHYEKKNEQLRQDYIMLSQELKKDESMLYALQRKDDRLYRSIFGMEPIPTSIREAGTGGAAKLSSIHSISDPEVVTNVYNEIDKILTKAKIQSNSFEDLEEVALNNQLLLARKPLIQPISPADRYWLTSTYGYRTDPFTKRRKSHHGIDMAGPYGLKIHATGDGVVKIAEHNRFGYGKEVMIDHEFGYSSRYAHLQDILVKSGEKVKRGQVIGTLGNTGRSTGPHLHYEVRYFNKSINPMYCFYEELSPKEYELITKRAATN
ncbi:M23 family metallopeptidase, partial [Bacteroidota bacterium]